MSDSSRPDYPPCANCGEPTTGGSINRFPFCSRPACVTKVTEKALFSLEGAARLAGLSQ